MFQSMICTQGLTLDAADVTDCAEWGNVWPARLALLVYLEWETGWESLQSRSKGVGLCAMRSVWSGQRPCFDQGHLPLQQGTHLAWSPQPDCWRVLASIWLHWCTEVDHRYMMQTCMQVELCQSTSARRLVSWYLQENLSVNICRETCGCVEWRPAHCTTCSFCRWDTHFVLKHSTFTSQSVQIICLVQITLT